MRLPDANTRANLRLSSPAQRFMWAAEQLQGAMFPSPAIVANPARGIPAKAITKGLAPSTFASLAHQAWSIRAFSNKSILRLQLPLNYAQLHRGVPLLSCIDEMSPEPALTYVGSVADVPPILDGSVQPTVERFLVEQLALMMTEKPLYNRNVSYTNPVINYTYLSEYVSAYTPVLNILTNVLRTGLVDNNRYGDITEIE